MRMIAWALGGLTVAIGLIAGCGSDVIFSLNQVSLSPASSSVRAGQTLQFSASSTISGTPLTFSVNGIPGGNASVGFIDSNGMYTAPSTVPAPNNVVTVTGVASQFPNSLPGSATVTLLNPIPQILSVTPVIPMGPASVTITGSQFLPGAQVLWNGVAVPANTVSATQISFSITTFSPGVYAVAVSNPNPGAANSASMMVTVAAPPVMISVSPTPVSIPSNGQQAFTATVSNTANTAVTWSATCGSVPNTPGDVITYAAPSTAGTCTVTATSVADPTKSASVVVTVAALPAVTISVSPIATNLQSGGQQVFTAAVGNTGNTAVIWSAPSCGSLSSTMTNPVTYTAPASGSCNAVITVTSVADNTKSAIASVTVGAPPVGISVEPSVAAVLFGGTQIFTATVVDTANTAVTWTASCGSLSSTTTNPVIYTAPSSGTCNAIITVTSQADPTKSAQASVSVGASETVNVQVTPSSSSILTSGSVLITATVSGTTNTAVTWSTDAANCGTLSNLTATTATYTPATSATLAYYPNCQGGITGTVPGVFHITATSVANTAQSATANILVLTPGPTPPSIPFPNSQHPRLWVTPADVTRLQSWATNANPIYAQGMKPLLQSAITAYNTYFFPGGKPASPYPDPGDSQGYVCTPPSQAGLGTGCLTEENAIVLAFNSLIDPNPSNRILYAQDARNLLMYAMNLAAQGHLAAPNGQPEVPFRSPAFAVYNRANLTSEEWPLIVDWIYNAKDAGGNNIFTSADKATIRNVFLQWAEDCLNAETTGGDSPSPRGVMNSPQLLPNNLPYRYAANNYYIAHGRLVTMMSLAFDPGDDAPVDPAQSPNQLGNSLRSYIPDATGAWLYQEYAMFGDPQSVATAYSIPGNGTGFGLASGGLPPEGMLYGESFGTMFGGLLALQTAGFNDPTLSGPQIALIGAPVWDRYVQGMISSLTPASFVPPSESYLGPVYEYASYGDLLRLWVTPDNINSFSLLSVLEDESGNQGKHQAEARWLATNVLPGGAAQIPARMLGSVSWSLMDGLEYFMLFDPNATAAPDPRPGYPLVFVDPGAGRIVGHSNWNADSTNTMFDYHASWESINHQDGNAGEFELYRKGEWLTKEMSNYDNNEVGLTTYYHNTLGLRNICPACPNGTPPLQFYETGEWANGSQFMLGDNAGDPTTLTSAGSGYVYAATDMTKLYNHPDFWTPSQAAVDITRAQRSIFWLNNDYIVIYDRATSKSSGLFKRFNLSLVASPFMHGQDATEIMADGQQLFIHTLLPQNATITSRYAAGDLNPIADLEPMAYVMTVEDASLPTDTRFLHVLQGADPGASPTPVTSLSSSTGTAFDGVLLGNTALLFIHDDAQTAAFASMSYSEPSTTTANYIAGLLPNATYTIAKTLGSPIQITIIANSNGTLHADAAGVLAF